MTHSPRYPKHTPAPLARMTYEGRDLGHAISPQDVLLQIRRLYETDASLLAAMQAGADRLQHDLDADVRPTERSLPALGDLPLEERQLALDEAREVSSSRIAAWRRRVRPMTWRELRVLFLGLREIGAP